MVKKFTRMNPICRVIDAVECDLCERIKSMMCIEQSFGSIVLDVPFSGKGKEYKKMVWNCQC